MTELHLLNGTTDQTFTLTRGVPASGKSTYAKQWVIAAPNRVRVNRDDIRQELHEQKRDYKTGTFYEQNSKDEERTTVVAHRRIRDALGARKSVLVDDTNLNLRFYKQYHQIAAEYGLKLGHVDFPITLEEAIRRNAARARVVPEDVIRRMYSNLGPNGEFHHWDGDYVPRAFVKPAERKMAFIYDMDGTLANISHYRHFVRGKFRNFDMFHRSSLFSPPNEEVLEMAFDSDKAGLTNIIVTARSEPYRSVTELWLDKHNVPFENLYMRAAGDSRQDAIVKAEILEEIQKDYIVVSAADDNENVKIVWKNAGIRTVVVPGFLDEEPSDYYPIDNPFRTGKCLRCGRPLTGEGPLGPD